MKKRAVIAVLILLVCGFAGYKIYNNYMYGAVDVIIDPGHGGSDFGANYNGRNEKDDNLEIALKVGKELNKLGVSNALTRKKDEYISLEDRCKIANRRSAKLFVSLHRNSADGANGVEIWISNIASKKDIELASNILSGLDKAGISLNRGVKKGYAQGNGNYYVNSHTVMPSCLVELGFINSEKDNKLFDENLDEYAVAIASVIKDTL